MVVMEKYSGVGVGVYDVIDGVVVEMLEKNMLMVYDKQSQKTEHVVWVKEPSNQIMIRAFEELILSGLIILGAQELNIFGGNISLVYSLQSKYYIWFMVILSKIFVYQQQGINLDLLFDTHFRW